MLERRGATVSGEEAGPEETLSIIAFKPTRYLFFSPCSSAPYYYLPGVFLFLPPILLVPVALYLFPLRLLWNEGIVCVELYLKPYDQKWKKRRIFSLVASA